MTITHRALVESEHFSFEAFGSDEADARKALLEGLQEHAGQFDTEAEWPDEKIAEAQVIAIGPGCSQFTDFDATKVVGREIIASGMGGISHRAMIEVGDADGVWGHLDAYGGNEAEAGETLRQALTLHQVHRENAAEYIARILPDMVVYPIRSGGAYRGNLVGPAGERLI